MSNGDAIMQRLDILFNHCERMYEDLYKADANGCSDADFVLKALDADQAMENMIHEMLDICEREGLSDKLVDEIHETLEGVIENRELIITKMEGEANNG